MKCVHVNNVFAHSTNCCVKKRNWLTIQNNSLVQTQQWQNAVPSDEEWPFGRNLLTQSFGTPVTWNWKRRWGKVTVLLTVAQCIVVDRHHYKYPLCLCLLHWWKHMFLWKFGVCKTVWHHMQTVIKKRTSHLTRCRRVPLLITCLSQGTLIVVLHAIGSMLLCVQCGKHTVRDANVDHCKLPSVVSDNKCVSVVSG